MITHIFPFHLYDDNNSFISFIFLYLNIKEDDHHNTTPTTVLIKIIDLESLEWFDDPRIDLTIPSNPRPVPKKLFVFLSCLSEIISLLPHNYHSRLKWGDFGPES